ncbi:sodium-dependent transporter [Psychrobacillus sp. FJAT-21963]|uniref:sodium-dependent transporter n=1 Tax=Psychrobacillus sp. FJAT-21963 TaxID=1712028 RepID=UPI0006FCD260|nr:sodium-dependent transporter [Psychrobacillus sp. FJAT-21963]KQL33449.1 transporter [Psychrobacillus sp. FJAT-21963]
MAKRDHFGSKIGFVLAAAGSAIGLGAIWKFPYMAGTNGGSVFVLLFILCTLLIGLPILLAEFIIGRKGQADAVTSFKKLAPKKPWFVIGWAGFFFSIIILSFYSVVGGWILSYLIRALTFSLNGTNETFYEDLFNSVISNPWEVIVGQGAFIFLTIWIVSGGIQGGIEKASKWMMPLLLIFFLVLAVRSLTLEGAMEGVKFLFVPDWSYFTWETALLALGQAFFSLSVGVSAMITYASYLPKETRLGNSALSVSLLNIGVSIMAGLVIFPAVFALGFSPNEGPGLVFIILPAVFEQIIFGQFFLILFFVLLLFATLTSSISMLEIVVSIGIKSKYERRKRAAWVFGILIFLIGIPSALSFGILSDIHILGMSIFDFADFLTSSFGLPLGALFISLFAGYVLTKSELQNDLKVNQFLLNTWRFIVRFAAPIAIIIVFIQGVMKLFV